MKFNNICILGMGYIGLPTACMFTSNGVNVLGVDIHPAIIETLNQGLIHIHEPGLAEAVNTAVAGGFLKAATTPQPADAFIIAVPTPFYLDDLGEYNGQSYKKADMRAVTCAARSILPVLRKGNLVVLESTSPPRTTLDLVLPILEESGLKAGVDFFLAYSPERVLPGQILRELVENARVIGGIDTASAQAGADLYGVFVKGEIHQTDSTTAEMVKLMENTYRDVNIAIANEFSRLSERFGVDVWEAIQLSSLHPRVKILSPGPGVGGHCISVDPWFFVETAPDLSQLIAKAREVNDGQPHFVVEKVKQALGGSLKGKRVAALGLAYKPDVDDLRESPAVEVVHLLTAAGALVRAYEPFKPNADLPGVNASPTLADAIADADLLLLLVNHSEFKLLDPAQLLLQSKARIAYDCINAWNIETWNKAGFVLHRLGDAKNQGPH
jgi:UDP-N-acetyl-D-mannosaminuronic acid dehydrogenase